MKRVQIQSFFWSVLSRIRTRKNSVFGHFSHSEGLMTCYVSILLLTKRRLPTNWKYCTKPLRISDTDINFSWFRQETENVLEEPVIAFHLQSPSFMKQSTKKSHTKPKFVFARPLSRKLLVFKRTTNLRSYLQSS